MRLFNISILLSLIGCRSDEGLQKFNATPQANITSHNSGDQATEGFVVTFVGTGTDANHGIDELTATWYSGAEIICAATPLPADGATTCERIITIDDTEIILVVKDPENASGETSVSLDILPSEAPTAEIGSPLANGIFYSDQLITFEGRVADNEDEVEGLTVTWNSSLDGDLDVANVPNGSGELVGAEYLTEGDHFLVLTVTDSAGKEGTDNVTIKVGPPNSAPSCEVIFPTDNSVGPQGEMVSFEGFVSDADVPTSYLTVAWRSDKDGELGTSTPDSEGYVALPFAELTVNSHVISMTVTDEVGEECISNIIYTVGTPPTVSIDAPVSGEVFAEGEAIVFTATVADDQDQPNDVSLTWIANGVLISTQGATSTGTATFSDSTLEFGTYNLLVTATDDDGLTDVDQVNFTVNGLPTQPLISISPEPAYAPDNLTVSLDTASIDPEGSAVNYTYEWLVGGAVQSAYTTSTVPASATTKNEQWTVRVTPNDGIADGPFAQATVVIQNTAPTLSSVTITPTTNVYNDTTLTCSVMATDPDETLTASYEWALGSTIVGSGATLDLGSLGGVPGDVVTCSASVVDSDGAAATNSATTTIDNRLPSVDSISLAPSVVYTNDTIAATVAFSDSDGQQVSGTYAWHVIDFATGVDSQVQVGNDSTLSGANHFDRDDEVYVVVTPNDGVEDGSSVTSNGITILNTAPAAATISISPNPASVGQDDLVCSVDTASGDDDGDAVVYTYVWTDGSGTVQQTTTATANLEDTFAGSGTTEGTWGCAVNPFDGTDSGNSVSATVVVESDCSSLTFDGGNDFVDIAMQSGQNSGATIEAWMNVANLSNNGFLLSGNCVGVMLSPSGVMAEVYPACNGHYLRYHASVPVSWPNGWFHLAVDVNQNTVMVYLNGVAVGNAGTTYDPGVSGTYGSGIGARVQGSSYDQYLQMNLFQLRVSHAGHYSADFTPALPLAVENDTVNLYDFSTDSGNIVTDLAGGQNGSITGAVWGTSCPEEDLDGDGFFAWEDCNDGDSSMPSNDADCDGAVTSDDCDDTDSSIYPHAGDNYNDGVDSDCDGLDCSAWTFGATYFALCPSNGGVTRSAGASQCVTAGYDGLVSIIDQSEHDSIKDTIATMPTSSMYGSMGNEYGWAWIGLMGPVLQWDSGLPYSYDGMSPGGDDDGMVYWRLVGYGQHDWGWNDTTDPNEVLPFICEKR